jgi:hypothetical protein
MARRARHRGLLAFPAEAPLTPSTLDQEIALAQRDEMRAQLTTLRPESEQRSGQLVYLSYKSSIRSFSYAPPHQPTPLDGAPNMGPHPAVVGCPQMPRPVHTRHLDRLMTGKR